MLFDQIAADAVDEDEGRLHRRDVELGAAVIRMGLDAAIGDRQRAAVAEQQHLVRVHAVGREFADAAKAVAGVIDADHAGGVVEIVLGGVEQLAVGREHAMAEEVPAGRAGDGDRLRRCRHGRRPRRTCRACRANTTERRATGSKRHVMAAIGQRRGEQQLALFRKHGDAAGPSFT